MKLRIVVLMIFFSVLFASPASSIVNGTPAVGSNYVVTMLFGDKQPQGYCTGAYFQPRVVVIAAHCVIKSGARAPELQRPLADFYVSQPGIDWQTPEAKTSRVRVLQIWTDPDYFNRWEPEKGLMETQVNDVAFLFLEKELNGPTVTRAANRDEIEIYRQGVGQGFHLGYGCLGGANGKVVSNDGKPYLAEGIIGTTDQPSHVPIRDRILNVLYPPGKSLCPGDSGSPLLMKKGLEVLYLGTLFAGGSWDDAAKGTNNRGVASATVLWPFIPTLEEEFKKFLVEESKQREIEAQKQKEAETKAAADLKVKQEVEAQLLKERQESILANTFYKDLQNCHALDAKAELQILEDGVWKPLAQAKGWDLAINCPVTNPVQPWTIASIDKGADIRLLRWRIWIPGSWDVTGNQFESLLSTEAKAAFALKAKQEADAKVAALKKTTLTCVKGKLTKKVTAVKPKCPNGYKVKK